MLWTPSLMITCCSLRLFFWTSDEEEGGRKINDQYRCQPHPGLQGKEGAQQFHLSCVYAVNSISRHENCGLHLFRDYAVDYLYIN